MLSRSRQYVRPAYGAKGPGVNLGIMFLCEAALGNEASITVDDWKLTKPPQVQWASPIIMGWLHIVWLLSLWSALVELLCSYTV